MTFYIKLSAYLDNIYLLGFPHAALGTVGYIRVNILRAYFKVSCQNLVLFSSPWQRGCSSLRGRMGWRLLEKEEASVHPSVPSNAGWDSAALAPEHPGLQDRSW